MYSVFLAAITTLSFLARTTLGQGPSAGTCNGTSMNYNGMITCTEIIFPYDNSPINYNDIMVFSYFSNGTSNLLEELAGTPSSVVDGVSTPGAVLSSSSIPAGTNTVDFPMSSWPTSITSYPYTASFGFAAVYSGGNLTQYAVVTVTSTSGTPVTHAQATATSTSGVTSTSNTSITSGTSTTTSATLTSTSATAVGTGAATSFGVNKNLAFGLGAGMLAGMMMM